MNTDNRIEILERQLDAVLANTDRAIAQTAEAIAVVEQLKQKNADLTLALQHVTQQRGQLLQAMENDAVRLIRAGGFTMEGTASERILAAIDNAKNPCPTATSAAHLEPVGGDLLPPIGSKVEINLASQDAWVEHTVVGYYVWGALSHQIKEGEKNAYRVFVRVVDAAGFPNARLLSEVRPSAKGAGHQEDGAA